MIKCLRFFFLSEENYLQKTKDKYSCLRWKFKYNTYKKYN